jgi:hypothetical protein
VSSSTSACTRILFFEVLDPCAQSGRSLQLVSGSITPGHCLWPQLLQVLSFYTFPWSLSNALDLRSKKEVEMNLEYIQEVLEVALDRLHDERAIALHVDDQLSCSSSIILNSYMFSAAVYQLRHTSCPLCFPLPARGA